MPKRIRSSVSAMHAYVPGEQPDAPDVVKLNTNENPYPPAPGVVEALGKLDVSALRKYPSPDAADARRAVAERHGCSPEQVLISNGSDEALALCTRAFVEDDEQIGYFTPSYSLYPVLAGIRAVGVAPLPLNADLLWDDETVPEDYDVGLFFLTNPNAPTGVAHPRERIEAFCDRTERVVVIDEAYADFCDWDCIDLALARDNVIVTRTLSKSYSLAGIRAGYAIGPTPLIDALHTIRDAYNVNHVTQIAMAAALRDRTHFEATRAKIVASREDLSRRLTALDFDVAPSSTNFIWARPRTVSAETLFDALRQRNIFVRYFPGPHTGEHIRISIGTGVETDILIAAIEAELGHL